MKPFFSIIMANYNGAEYISKTIESILYQSFTGWEVVVVDDASTDSSVDLLNKFSENNSKINVIHNQTQCGPSVARNRAINAATGEWLVVVDSDDILHKDRLINIKSLTDKTGANIISDNIIEFYDDAAEQPKLLLNINESRFIELTEYLQPQALQYGYLKPFLQRSFILNHGIRYRENLSNSEDYFLIVDMLIHGATYYVSNLPGYFYRKHSSSISYRRNYSQLNNILKTIEDITNETKENKLISLLNQRYNSLINERDYSYVVQNIKSKQTTFRELLRLIQPKFHRHMIKLIKSQAKRILKIKNPTKYYQITIITTDKKLQELKCLRKYKNIIKIFCINESHYIDNLLQTIYIVQSTDRCIFVSNNLYDESLNLLRNNQACLNVIPELVNNRFNGDAIHDEISTTDEHICTILSECMNAV